MKKNKIIKLVGVISIGILVSLAFVKVGYLQSSADKEQPVNKEFCGPIVEGLKFCTDRQKISVVSGDQVVLNLSLTNTGEREIAVKTNSDLSKYNLRVIDENGISLLTKLENKRKKGLMTDDDQREFITSLTRACYEL